MLAFTAAERLKGLPSLIESSWDTGFPSWAAAMAETNRSGRIIYVANLFIFGYIYEFTNPDFESFRSSC